MMRKASLIGEYMSCNKEVLEKQKQERLGMTNISKQGLLMKIIEYINATNIIVEFEDGYKKRTRFEKFLLGSVLNPNYKRKVNIIGKEEKLYEINTNKEGYQMMIVEYNKKNDIVIEFLDDFHKRIRTTYYNFQKGEIKNPYKKNKYGGITGEEFPTKEINSNKHTKEYSIWRAILSRVFDSKKKANAYYNKVKICEEWMYFPNFVKWLMSQPNYEKWKNGKENEWHIDKDILSEKNNKIYSPNTCCLVPTYINESIAESGNKRNKGKYPLGVGKTKKRFYCKVRDRRYYFDSPEEAEKAYIEYKNKLRKEDAIKAYKNGDITKKVFDILLDDNFLFR